MDKVAFSIFGITVAWYAIIIVIGIIIGCYIAFNELKRHDYMDEKQLGDFIFFMILFGFLGARLWYVIFDYSIYSGDFLSIFNIKEGGLAIHGAILSGFLYVLYYTKKHKIYILKLSDLAVPSLLIGQAIGRWGNFMNQEAHGGETTKEFLSNTLHLPDFIVNNMYINSVYYHPTFLYESIFNLIAFILVMTVLRKRWRYSYGKITAFYLVWYGLLRTFIESMRTDALPLFNTGLRVAQITSIFMFISGVILFIYLYKKENKNV